MSFPPFRRLTPTTSARCSRDGIEISGRVIGEVSDGWVEGRGDRALSRHLPVLWTRSVQGTPNPGSQHPTGHAAPHAMLHRRHQHPSCELISPYGITSQCGLVYTVRVRVYVVVVLDSNSLLGLVSWPVVPFHTSWDDKLAHASHAARCTPAHSVQREAKCCSRCVRRAVLACALCDPLYCV